MSVTGMLKWATDLIATIRPSLRVSREIIKRPVRRGHDNCSVAPIGRRDGYLRGRIFWLPHPARAELLKLAVEALPQVDTWA